jgi:hypothetical protein
MVNCVLSNFFFGTKYTFSGPFFSLAQKCDFFTGKCLVACDVARVGVLRIFVTAPTVNGNNSLMTLRASTH